VPWVEPLDELDLTERHYEGLVQRPRAKNPYFRLLARDPEVLGARTKTDLDIFYNTADGLGRAERELGATVASRSNGCVYCASVHSAFATHFSKRGEDVQRLARSGTCGSGTSPITTDSTADGCAVIVVLIKGNSFPAL